MIEEITREQAQQMVGEGWQAAFGEGLYPAEADIWDMIVAIMDPNGKEYNIKGADHGSATAPTSTLFAQEN